MKLAGICIGIASSGRKVDLRWAMSLTALTANGPVGCSLTWVVKTSEDRARNREIIVEKAIELGCDYVMMIDDDTVCPNFTLKYLHYQIEQDPEVMVCGGIYCTKEEIPCPIVFKDLGGGPFWRWKVGDVFECKGLGTGCMMIKTEVFQHLSKPWFFEPHETPVDGTVNINGNEYPVTHSGGTDDLYFCNKVTEAGFKILAHGAVLPVHIDDAGKLYTMPIDSYPCKGADLESFRNS